MGRGWGLDENEGLQMATRVLKRVMHSSETRELAINLWSVPKDAVAFRILKDGKPVSGATVTMCTKEMTPRTNSRVADETGIVMFNWGELFPYPLTSGDFPNVPWLIFCSHGGEYAVWKDDAKFKLATLYDFSLKRYTKVPTFFIKTECRDIIGADLFASAIASIQEWFLGMAGFELVKVEGKGTKAVTVYFKLPFTAVSPITVDWKTVWEILKILAIVGGIIAVLMVWKWTFGEWAAPLAGAIIVLLIISAAAALVPKKEERKGG